MSGRQVLARLCAARISIRAWRPGTQLAAMPGSTDSLDRAAMHSTASTSSSAPGASAAEKETIAVTFYDEKDKSEKTVRAVLGQSLMEAAHANEVDLEGACEGSLACSTCHIVLEDANLYNTLPEPTDDENDMLDLAYGLTETSRLGCQVIAAKELDGIRVRIPGATRNFAVDGHVPKPH